MNLDFCPNKTSKEFKEMSSIFGEDKAYFLWMRNKGNHLEKAPNGADSKLFDDLLKYFKGDRKEALRAKAKVYRNEFIEWFGDWLFLSQDIDLQTKDQVSLIFKRIPQLSKIGTEEQYAQYIQTIFPNSQDKSIYWHGSDSDFSRGFKSAKRGEGSGAPETKERNDFYLAKQAWSVLLYVSGVNRKSVDKNGFSIWNKLWFEFKEIMANGRRENNDWKNMVINENTVRLAIPDKKGIFDKSQGKGHGKWLKERKADYGYENKSDKEFFEEILGVKWGVDTFNTWTQRNAEIFKSLQETESGIYPAVINTVNPIREKGQDTYYEEHRGLFTKADAEGNDAILGSETDNEFGSDIAVVLRNNNNVHFLGTQEDMDAFSKFINRQNVSKVVDENGEPKIVYHGTDNYGFDVFDPLKADDKISLFTSDSKYIASTYTKHRELGNLLRQRLIDENAIELIKNKQFDKLKNIIENTINRSHILTYFDEVDINNNLEQIYKELKDPNLLRDDVYALYDLMSKIEDSVYKTYSAKVEHVEKSERRNTPEYDKIKIRDYDRDDGSYFIDKTVLFDGDINDLIDSILFDSKIYSLFENIKNPLIIDEQRGEFGASFNWNELYFKGKVWKTRDLAKFAKDEGYDGVIFEDIIDHGPYSHLERFDFPVTDADVAYSYKHEGEDSYTGGNVYASNIYISFNSNQLKSAVKNNGEFSKTNDNIYKESFVLKETEWFVKDTFLKQAYNDRLHKDKHLSIDDVLSYLSKSNTTASVVNLINFINKEKNNGLIPLKLSIRVVSGIDMAWTVGNILQGRRACYDADRLTIYIDADAYYENGDSANVILHEIMHAITLNLLNNNPEVRAKLESTLETYRKYYPQLYLRIDNHSLAEFVADIWTNPITIKRLLSIPYKSESLFDRILNILRQLLKPFFKEGTLSEKASIELVELLESTPPMRSGSSGIYYAPSPTVDQIQKEYDDISDKIRKLFGDLYKRFDKMPNKSTTRRRTLTEIFKTIQRLKNEQSEKAIEIALETAAEQLGVINKQTGAPLSNGNLYAWFINQELKDNPYENITPQQIQDIYKHLIGFYRSILATIPDDASVLLNPTTRLNRQDVLNQLNVIENFWKHAVEMIGEREIDNMIDNFTGLAIPQEQKENMKVVYRDWLHKNWFHGDITSVTSLFTSYGQSGNPIVKIAFHLTLYAELKTQEEMLAACVPILERFLKVNSLESYTKPGWQKIFWELNREGIPTGKWIRDINYGQYEQDLNEFVKDLNERYDNLYGHHYIYDELGMVRNSVTGVYVEDEEWIGGVEPTYVSYLLELLRWKCEHANLRYTFDYYKERLSRPYDEVDYPEGHGLSLKTLLLYENIQNTINYYLGLCTGEDGIPHPELPKDAGGLTNAERAELDKAKDELKKISSPFEEDGTPKVDEEYLTAMEILTWQKFVQNKQHGSNINWAMFLAAEAEALKAAYDAGDPSILANFYKYNSEVRIDPDFLESIFGVSEDISPADIIIKKIYQKCLENLTKVKDNIYTRDIEPFKNNTLFWLNYRQIVQDVMDNKQNDRLADPTEDFNDVAYYYNLPYVDGSGRMFDIFGRVATNATPQSEILTWQNYIVNYYKDIAIRNNGTIPGVEDEYGNPIIFYGSDMEIADQVRRTMFTYEATWFDKKGVMHTELRPLPIFTTLMPIDKRYIVNVPTSSRFTQPKDNIFKNTDFVESEGISEQPKRLYYDNSEAYNKMAKNRRVKALYDDCIDCMKDMQKVMGFKNRTFNYKLPMMNADSTALLSRGNLGAILRSSQEVQNDDTDMRNIDAGIRNADGTIDFDIPLRLLHELKDMHTLSSDVVLSVMLYVLMAYNYRNKKAIQDTLQTIHDNLTSDVRSRTATDYDRFKDNPTDMTEAINDENSLKLYEAMMDSTMYGMDTGKSSKAHKETTKLEVFGRKFGNFVIRAEGVMTLGLNLLSMFAGGYDSVTKMLRESIMNRYMSFIDLSKSLLYVHGILWKVIANIGDPLSNCKMVAMMKLNGLSKDYTKLFDNLNHNRVIRTLNNLIMGGYSMFDYFSNMVMLRAHYRNVRFYDGDVIPKGFYTAYEMRQAFKAAGKSWKLGALAHSLCKTSLWSVYEFKNHLAVVKDLYISKTEEAKAAAGGIGLKWSDFVTDKVKTDIRSKSQQRSALYNGMAPDNDRARYLKTVWGKIIFAMRHWYQMVLQRSLVGTDDTSVRNVTDTSTEQIKFGKSIFKPGKKVEALTEEQSASRMGWNFETNAPLEEIVKATFRALIKTLRMAKAALSLKIGKFKDIKLSNVEKYAIRGIITQLLFLELMFYSFIPIMNAAQQIEMPTNKKDAELSIDNIINNLLKYPILYWANAHIRSYESHKAEVNPLEPKAFIKTSSALMGALDHQTDLIDMAKEGAGMSTHTLDEEISTGSKYKYYTRGERYTRLAIGIWNNTITSLTIPGIKYNTQWYMNMYGDSYRQMGYDFSISAGNQQSSNRPKIERPKIERPKIKRPKINRPNR